MCEQTPVEYKDGDIVWVKLGSCWWPGEVQDVKNLSEDALAAFKKPIIAAVKFFDEDYYEFIKSLDRIYLYNCSKKNEFIKKGLDLHRAKHDYMKKFPEDVTKAETKTNGNPNIIEDPMFAPEKKTNVAALIFGTPKQKKSPRKSIGSLKKSLGSKPSTPKSTPTKVVTHPRFLGRDDHEVRILVQSPGQREMEVEDNKGVYKCGACGFSTERIDVSIIHHKSHIQGDYTTPLTSPRKNKRPYNKKNKKVIKMTKSKTSSIIEDLDLIDKGLFFQADSSDNDTLGSSCESEPEAKRRKRKGRKKTIPKKEDDKKPPVVIDIRGDLLAEWDDESDTEREQSLNSTNTPLDLDSTTTDNTSHQNEDEKEKVESDSKTEDKSCFDFEEDEENEVVKTSIGRKIPRVIPPSDKQKTGTAEVESSSAFPEGSETKQDSPVPSQSIGDDLSTQGRSNVKPTDSGIETPSVVDHNETPILDENPQANNETNLEINPEDNNETYNKESDKKCDAEEQYHDPGADDVAFKDILEATAVPELPAIPHSLKFEQNFHDSKKIKFPDKCTEDAIKESEPTKSGMQETEPEDKAVKEEISEMSKVETKEHETTSKLINPKKRFVKSFEDFEQQIYNEQRKLLELEHCEKIQDSLKIDVESNDTVLVSADVKEKRVEKPNVVEVSKLKTQLMSKLGNTDTRPRRDRILTSHNEELDEFYINSSSLTNKYKSTASTTKTMSFSEIRSRSPQKMSELPEQLLELRGSSSSLGINEENDLLPISHVLETDESLDRENNCIAKFTALSPVPPEVPFIIEKQDSNGDKMDSSEKDKPYNFKRRLSMKMSELSETKPVDMKEVTEFLELDQKVQLEPTQVVEDKSVVESINMLPVEHIIEAKSEVLEPVNTAEVEPEESASKTDAALMEENLIIEEPMDTSTVLKPDPETIKHDEEAAGTEVINSSTDINYSCTSVDSQNGEDLSALTTLATVSELSTNLDMHCASASEKSKIIENNLSSSTDVKDKTNVNFVTVDDLAEGQVEISDSAISKVKSKPISLSSFSVDFQDSNDADASESVSVLVQPHLQTINQPDLIEMSLGKVFEGENDSGSRKMTKSDSMDSFDNYDVEDQIPSLLVSAKTPHKKLKTKMTTEKSKSEFSSSSTSKLLEILTDGKTKLDTSQKSPVPSTCGKDGKGQKESPLIRTFSKSKEEKVLNILKEGSPIIKSKAKEDTILTTTRESTVPKILAKSKDEKLYTITKEPPKTLSKLESKNSKFIFKSSPTLKSFPPATSTKSTKPIILSERIIKTLSEPTETVSVQKVTSKRNMQDVEDIDTFIIQKPPKKMMLHEEPEAESVPKKNVASKGKAKILQQTIIKPSGDVIQPIPTSVDDSMFDINSMPIVLSDQILTTDGIENMPVVISETCEPISKKPQNEQKIPNKPVTTQSTLFKTYSSPKIGRSRIYQSATTSSTKILKSNPAIISRPGKQDKYIILPSSTSPSTSKYTVGKKQNVTKRMTPVIVSTPNVSQKIQTATTSEPSGNKIMIVTNQQGQQSRVLLTPAQQKLFGYQSPGSKLVKSTLKGNILQKSNTKSTVLPTTSNVSSKIVNAQETITSANATLATEPILMPVKTTTPLRNVRALPPKGGKFQIQPQKISLHDSLNTFKGQQKTIVIKNQQGQIVKKFQGTDDAFLEQQVAEQVQAIKASSGSFSAVNKMKPPAKRSYKKPEAQKNVKLITAASKLLKNEGVPPLAPISPKRADPLLLPSTALKTTEHNVVKAETTPQKPLNQLIIQDALGNQTTIMEGQILALPSGDTIDGQPQSYMLVTLDESGNLTPLNNEALLSLDPNLSLGGDLSNMVLQLDDGANKKPPSLIPSSGKNENVDNVRLQESPQIAKDETVVEAPKLSESLAAVERPNVQTVTCSLGNENNQQLIITGDPISTQKFIESLTDGNPDLANLLANTEGNIIIQTDEQQILINTDSENQVLLPLNAGVMDSSESDGNPIFSTHPLKNQDILAAALADTDVFQQEPTVSHLHSKLGQSQLSPNSGLYQAGVSNVLETTLSLSSPIMTPLEVPSISNKKIPDEEMDILTTEVPKNVDLPITITDPNISQTVAQQQVVSLIGGDLTTNLDLPLTISEANIAPFTSAEMNSPSFVYPLSLDESVDVHKSFSGPISMPLLTEDPQESMSVEETEVPPEQIIEEKHGSITSEQIMVEEIPLVESEVIATKRDLFESSALTDSIIKDDGKSPAKGFLGTTIESEEGLCTLGGAMCSSLSEPPPDMFDLSLVGSHYVTENEMKNSISSSIHSEDCSVNEPMNQSDSTNELSESNDEFNKFESYEEENKMENNSVLVGSQTSSSPLVNVDENSCEIPVQPQIITNLSSPTFDSMDVDEFESHKRVEGDFDVECHGKKIEFD